jgi:hypothetical protein
MWQDIYFVYKRVHYTINHERRQEDDDPPK